LFHDSGQYFRDCGSSATADFQTCPIATPIVVVATSAAA